MNLKNRLYKNLDSFFCNIFFKRYFTSKKSEELQKDENINKGFFSKIVTFLELFYWYLFFDFIIYRFFWYMIFFRTINVLYFLYCSFNFWIYYFNESIFFESGYFIFFLFVSFHYIFIHIIHVYRTIRDEYIKTHFYEAQFKTILNVFFILGMICLYLTVLETYFMEDIPKTVIWEDD